MSGVQLSRLLSGILCVMLLVVACTPAAAPPRRSPPPNDAAGQPVRRQGAHNQEMHFAAIARSPAGDIPTAIIVRRDGRDIGRERVIDLRGALHHYNDARAGLLATTGQVMSGAREEAREGLIGLGYTPLEAERLLGAASGESAEELVAAALRNARTAA